MPYNIYVKGNTHKVLLETNEIQFGQKHQVNQEKGTPKCDTKRLSKLYQNPNQHMNEEKIKRNKIKQHTRDKTAIENKIPYRSKDTNRRLLFESFK